MLHTDHTLPVKLAIVGASHPENTQGMEGGRVWGVPGRLRVNLGAQHADGPYMHPVAVDDIWRCRHVYFYG